MPTSLATWRRFVAWLDEPAPAVEAWHPFAAARDDATQNETEKAENWSKFDHLAAGPPPVL